MADHLDLSLALSLGRPTPSSPPHSAGQPEPIPTLSSGSDIPQHSRDISRYENQFLCGASAADRAAFEAAERQVRLRDRKVRENEPPLLGRKLEIQIPEAGFPAAVPMQVQYVPVVSGYGVPCVMPCWAPAIPGDGGDASKKKKKKGERNVYQPVASRYSSAPGMKGCGLELNVGKGVAGVPSTASNSGSSSSGISAHQSGLLHVGSRSSSSSDARTNSSLIVEKPQPQISSLASNPQEKYAGIQATEASTEKLISSNAQSTLVPTSDNTPAAAPRKLEGANSVNKPIALVDEKESKSRGPSLPRMPCVAATGDGPNGKTITGVLYRYTKSEVSILCVCHGTSFTPAEFVKHAGGTETEHPMRQIVVVPS